MKTNRSVIVQCRLSSTRLPGKALKDLGGKPVLAWVLEAMKKVKADSYFVATDEASYEYLKPICDKYNFICFAGDLNDVLKRFCDLIKKFNVKTVIRATADNPFLFYEAAEESVEEFENRNKGIFKCDYLTYSGLPHGSGVEIFSGDSLLKAQAQTDSPYDHEHVGPALYNHKENFKCDFVPAPVKYNHPDFRTTIDTPSDYLRAVQICSYLGTQNAPFTTQQIVEACESSAVKNPVVLVPSVEKGHGTGHLHRCLEIALKTNSFVYISKNKTLEETQNIVNEYIEKGLNKNLIIDFIPDENYKPVIITDCFKVSESQIQEFKNNKSLICIDEGSEFTDCFDYVMDIIPSLGSEKTVNFVNPDFIQKPNNLRKEVANVVEKIEPEVLVCLGGEDPAHLSVPAVFALKEALPAAKITVILTNEIEKLKLYETDVEIIAPVPGLREKLHEYDLVLTHYGLTAFEALAAGCGVILLPTTKLHVELAKKYNFAFVENINKDEMIKALNNKNLIKQQENSVSDSDLFGFVKQLGNGKKHLCPVCGKNNENKDLIISRNKFKTYRRCNDCGMIYLSWSCVPERKYEKSYFFDEYKNQYGKTYTEDFDSIKAQGFRRVSEIKSICKKLEGKSVLDIGCAYGPFLAAASDLKMVPFGTDISDDAVDYVNKELHIPATASAFPVINIVEDFGIENFDVVTMWYVIEHFKDLDAVLTKVSSIVKKGGVFAFSTPSGEGVSALRNTESFYVQSPSDHFTVWEPTKANKILKKYGFKVVKIVSTGHHPERFSEIKTSGAQPGSKEWNKILKLSQRKNLGDTVEIYCKKIGR